MVLVAVLAHSVAGLVLPRRHTLSPQAAAPPTLARRGAPLYAQVDEELQETVEKSGPVYAVVEDVEAPQPVQ